MDAVGADVDLDAVGGLDKARVARQQAEQQRREHVKDEQPRNDPESEGVPRTSLRITMRIAPPFGVDACCGLLSGARSDAPRLAHTVWRSEQQDIGATPCEQSIGDHADNAIDALLELLWIVDAQARQRQ